VSARLFAAVDLPDAVRADLAAFGRACAAADPALRAVGAEGLHVTLAFLGHRPLEDVEAAAAAVGAAVAPRALRVALALGAPLWLAPRRPHVLTVALRDAGGALARLQAAVATGLAAALDWTPDARAFRPHVTVARVRRGVAPRREDVPAAPEGAFTAVALTLYRSHLGGGPARYEALARVPLAA
jgi:RNA 2',3'-cyclic 3'-phosphodiesterase